MFSSCLPHLGRRGSLISKNNVADCVFTITNANKPEALQLTLTLLIQHLDGDVHITNDFICMRTFSLGMDLVSPPK